MISISLKNIKKSQMPSTKFQTTEGSPYWINYNNQKFNDQNSFKLFEYLIIDIWNLFVICYLLFGALIQNLFNFMDKH